MARSSVRRALLILLVLAVTPSLAHADRIYRYGYRTQYDAATLVRTPAGYVWAVPSITSAPSVGITGAPLHGLVCSRGTIAELPVERQGLYIDGSTIGQPGYRCLDFQH
jgi:hypothetical protein